MEKDSITLQWAMAILFALSLYFLHPLLCVNKVFSPGLSTTGTWDYFWVAASVFSCPGIAQYTFSSALVMPFPWTLAPAYAALLRLTAVHPHVQLTVPHSSARMGSPAHTRPPLSSPALPDTGLYCEHGIQLESNFLCNAWFFCLTHTCADTTPKITRTELSSALLHIPPSQFLSGRCIHLYRNSVAESQRLVLLSPLFPSFLSLARWVWQSECSCLLLLFPHIIRSLSLTLCSSAQALQVGWIQFSALLPP